MAVIKIVQVLAVWLLPLWLGMASCTTGESNKSAASRFAKDVEKAKCKAAAEHRNTRVSAARSMSLERSPRLERIVARLAKGRKWDGIEIPVYVVTGRYANSWATEDGIINVSTGLTTLAASDDELAAALAHELAHIELNHLKKQRRRHDFSNGFLSVANWTVGALMAYGQFKAGGKAIRGPSYVEASGRSGLLQLAGVPAGATLGAASGYFIVQRGRKKDELEADKASVSMLADAGYKPEAALTLWRRIGNSQKRQEDGGVTHPSDEERLKKLELEVKIISSIQCRRKDQKTKEPN